MSAALARRPVARFLTPQGETKSMLSSSADTVEESGLAVPVDLCTQAELACVEMSETRAAWRKIQALVHATRAEAQVTRAAAAHAVAESQKRRAARIAPLLYLVSCVFTPLVSQVA
jgi:hypothetical protein